MIAGFISYFHLEWSAVIKYLILFFIFYFYQNLLLYSNTMWSKMPPQRRAHSNHVILCHSLGHTSTTVLKTQNLLDYFNTRVIWVDVYILIKSAKNFIHMVCVSVRVIISRRFPETQSLTPSESCACEWPDILCLYTYTSVLAIKSTSSTSVGLHGWSFTNSFMLYLCSFLQLRNFSNINLIFCFSCILGENATSWLSVWGIAWMYLWMYLLHRVFDKNLFFFCYFTSFPLPTFCFPLLFLCFCFLFFLFFSIYPHRSRGLS